MLHECLVSLPEEDFVYLMKDPVDLVLHDPQEVLQALTAAGLEPVERYLRGPLREVEAQTERFYVLARQA